MKNKLMSIVWRIFLLAIFVFSLFSTPQPASAAGLTVTPLHVECHWLG